MFCHTHRAGQPAGRLASAATFILGAVISFAFVSAEATTAAGRTKGEFSASPTGAATYTIPIWAPPGPNGIQPDIALVYSSQLPGGPGAPFVTATGQPPCGRVANHSVCPPILLLPQQSASSGSMGVGWTIQGLSSIYRCNLTVAQDAGPAPVALATSDGYCMDGQRLRLTSGNYGLAGSTYQTEIANFVNVTAYGIAGNGPAYWLAQDRNGKTYSYGNGGGSQVLASGSGTADAWLLNEVSDPYSNTMTISYNTATGAAVPATISWTPSSHGSSNYNYTMTFAYGANAVPPRGYVAGTPFYNPNLLSSIAVASAGTAVKTYYLYYEVSTTTGRDLLNEVQECAGSGTSNCLSATTITYQTPTGGISASGNSTSISTAKKIYAHYDFNGDGYTDLLFSNGTTWYVAFGSSSGYGTPVTTGISASTTVLAGNLLGTGKDVILANNGGTWYYYTWNGAAFTSASTGLSYATAASQFVLADVNGDGLPDLVSLTWSSSGVSVGVNLNTENGTSVSFGAAQGAFGEGPSYFGDGCTITQAAIAANSDQTNTLGTLRYFDFNGDGRQDIVLQLVVTHSNNGPTCTGGLSNNPLTYELISNGTSTVSSFAATLLAVDYTSMAFLNWNSDACTDFYTAGSIYISGCNGSTPVTVSVPGTVIGALDWNGDGWTDLLVQNGSTVGVYVSTGNGIGNLVATSIPYSSSTTYFTFDANGDGLDDLGYVTSTGAVGYYLHNGALQPPDLATSFTDGFGNSASPTYVSIIRSNYVPTTDRTYPYQSYIGPMYVVSEAVFNDPSSSSGGTYNKTFSYKGAWVDLQGRGFLGFERIQSFDSRNSLWSAFYYDVIFPYTGILDAYYLTQDQAQTLFVKANWINRVSTVLNSTQYEERYFVYFNNVTFNDYEVSQNPSENAQLITTSSTNYTYDNYGNPTLVATTLTDEDSGSPYNGQTWTATTTYTPAESTNPWCLSLFSEIQAASTASNGSTPVTINRSLSPDTTHCDYTQIITQPNTSFQVTEVLAYDNFGNVNSDTVTGSGMSGRTATANWGTTGQFVNTLTDASGATATWTYTSLQSLGFGVPDSVKDANNLPTAWTYDGFGRKTQETRPNNTYTVWTYQTCAPGSCITDGSGLVVGHTVYNYGGTYQSSGTDYLDSVDRPLVSNQVMLSGSYSRNEVRYDSLGNVRAQAFPCTWSSLATDCTYWATYSHDVLNRLTQAQRPISSTNSTLQTTSYVYAGRTATVTDPQSNTTTTVTDVNGWLRQSTDAYGKTAGYTTTIGYDAAGDRTSVTDSGGNTLWSGTYDYGIGAFLVTATDNDLGAWTFTPDALGELIGWKDAKGQSFSATYDALSRPRTRTEPDLFAQWTWGSSASNHNVGKLQSECTGTGTACTSSGYLENDAYDSYGRLSQRAITVPGYGVFTYTWAYNATTGLLNTLTYPTSTSGYALELQYGYANGVMQTITDISDTPNVAVWTADTMDPMGHVTEETLGNGIVTNRSYDAVTQWLGTAQSGVGGGSAVKNLSFLYDEVGNLTQREDNNLGLTENIYYDNDYRFSYSKLNGAQNLSVSYATNGNIKSRSDVASGATWTYGTNQIHAVTQAGSGAYTYAYDANGNATSRQGSSITWSSYNYPIDISAGSGSTAETVSFSYGPDRQRTGQNYSGNSTYEATYYIGRLMEMINGNAYRHYIYAGSNPVAVYVRSSSGNTFNYSLSDHQASVASITNSSGVQVVGESFTPFGARRNPATWSGPDSNADLTTIAGITRQGYTFQTALGLWMGMNHMNGRVEDAVTGRMLSGDPYIPDPTNSQSYNRYSYVNNNPLTFLDPTGFESQSDSDCDPATDPDCKNEGPDPGGPTNQTPPQFNGVPPFVPTCDAMGCWVPDMELCWSGSNADCQIGYKYYPNTNFVPPLSVSGVPEAGDSGTFGQGSGSGQEEPLNKSLLSALCRIFSAHGYGTAGFSVGDGFSGHADITFTDRSITAFFGLGVGGGGSASFTGGGGLSIGKSTGATFGVRTFVTGTVSGSIFPVGGSFNFSGGTDGFDASAGAGAAEGNSLVAGLGVNVTLADGDPKRTCSQQ